MYIKTADFAVSSTLHYIVLIINVPSYTCGSEKKKRKIILLLQQVSPRNP